MSVKYEIIKNSFDEEIIQRTDKNGIISFIPKTESNSDYQTYLRWVENPNASEFQTPWVEPQLTK